MAAAALLWSTGGIAIKALPEPPLPVAFYRSAFAAVALLLFLRPRWRRPTPAFAVALVSYAACLTTFVVATKWTTAANAIFLQYSGVVWVLLASPLVAKEPLRDAMRSPSPSRSEGWLSSSSESFTRRAAGTRRRSPPASSSRRWSYARLEHGGGAEAAVTYGNLLTAVCLFPLVRDQLAISPRSATILVFLGVVQLAAAYALFVRGLRHVTATQASLIGMLEPICNPIWVFLFLGERPGGFAILGGGIVLGAVAWRTFGAQRRAESRRRIMVRVKVPGSSLGSPT